MKPIVRNIQTGDLYEYLGDDTFENIRTGQSGLIGHDRAKEFLRINADATHIINEYPIVKDLIRRLNLSMPNPITETNFDKQ